MRLMRQDERAATADGSPIFVGQVLRQDLVAEGDVASLRVAAVTFKAGARNRWHRHSTEQVLVVTHGRGVVATDAEELRVTPGDVVLVQPGERHWHGAEPGADFTHLSILVPGETTIADDR